MGTDYEVRYDSAAEAINAMGKYAKSMQDSIVDAFKEIVNMAQYWEGNSYNSFAAIANMSVSTLNNMFNQTVSALPNELYGKIKLLADQAGDDLTVSYVSQDLDAVSDIPDSGSGAFGLFTDDNGEITTCQNTINEHFDDASTAISDVETELENMQTAWPDSHGTQNVNDIKNALSTVNTIITNLKNSLSDIISERRTTIETLTGIAGAAETATEMAEDTVDNLVEAANTAVSNIKEKASNTWKSMIGLQ